MKRLLLLLCIAAWPWLAHADAAFLARADVQRYIDEHVASGQFNRPELEAVFANVDIKPNVLAILDRPSTSHPWYQFRSSFYSERLLNDGVAFWKAHAAALERAKTQYGVPPELIVAILGIESHYGRNTGSFRVADVLATIGFNYPRRAAYFRDELTQMLKSNLEKVVQHGKRADSIVKNMLLHSREGSGEQRPADINVLLDESLNLAYHGARAEKPEFNITLRRDLDPDAGTINVFPQEITRAFINLISNGFYAASKRKAENGEADFEPVLSAATKNLGNHIEIRIRDNGTGIPPEVKDKIFNPFFTTKPSGEGTGLGLSMSHDIIVKQHGGSIDVETEPGLFTEFKIVLPRPA